MYVEGSYKQLLFGVSQQDANDRLPGQNAEQINMTSDLTFNLRRRAPLRFIKYLPEQEDNEALSRYTTTVAGQQVTLLTNAATGEVSVYDVAGSLLYSATNSYLQTIADDTIRYATLGDSVYIANLDVTPTIADAPAASGYVNPERAGFFYILGGQYGKKFRLTVTNKSTSTSTTVSYTVPDGSTSGDAAKATPEYIATKLVDAAKADAAIGTSAGVTYTRESGYVYVVSSNFDITLSSDSGSTYIQTSSTGSLRSTANLPARLPDVANGFIVGIGTGKTLRFYRWETDNQRWLEDASWDSLKVLDNMPIKLSKPSGSWSLATIDWEPRTSGDTESSPVPNFVESGITGMSSFQGRLVILAKDYINMSASTKPERFFRSTLESLKSDDPIEIASTASQAAPYTWASAFNKDLVIWADQYQSVISGSTAITPSNANLAVMNQYAMRGSTEPVVTGRNVFFAAPRSSGYDGIWEMLPGDYTQSQLSGMDVTNHIPRYISGQVRLMAASTTSNILVAAFTEERNTLLVHEYMWSEGSKIHHSWHKWVFDWDVEQMWFIGDRMYLLFRVDDGLAYAMLDLRAGAGAAAATTARLDMAVTATVTQQDTIRVPEEIARLWSNPVAFSKDAGHPYVRQDLDKLPDEPGFTVFQVLGAEKGDTFTVGNRYESSVEPTAPVIRDDNDVPITTQRTLLHKYVLTIRDTGEFSYTLGDKFRPAQTQHTSPMIFGSPELTIGEPAIASGQQYIPARVDMPSSKLVLSTTDVYDLNITGLEYGYRYHQRYGRRR